MLFLLFVDSDLGKFDHFSLPDQDLMEMMIAKTPPQEQIRFKNIKGEFLDVCRWSIVKCDEEKNVVSIQSPKQRPTALDIGIVDLSCIPQSVKTFALPSARMRGKIETQSLPRGLTHIRVDHNTLFGTIGWEGLPQQLQSLLLRQNALIGSVHLQVLPRDLRTLDISDNNFTGTVSFDSLPQRIKSVDMSCNALTGEFQMLDPPVSLKRLRAKHNNFQGTIVVSEAVDVSIQLRNNAVCVQTPSGMPHPNETEMLEDGARGTRLGEY